MLKAALLVLTVMGSGDIRMSLSETEDAEDCEATRQAVVATLATIGRAPMLAVCGETALRLTEFDRRAPAEAVVNRYRVTVPGPGGYTVEPLSGDAACTPAPEAAPRVFCTLSAQEVIAAQ